MAVDESMTLRSKPRPWWGYIAHHIKLSVKFGLKFGARVLALCIQRLAQALG